MHIHHAAVVTSLLLAGPALAAGILPSSPATTTVSTVPANGDVNPYGVAFVPKSFPSGGALAPGDILVSNFNASSNLQGTGTTIVKVRGSTVTPFFQGMPTLGLTTALVVLKSGFVIVGNFPSPTGMCSDPTTGTGSLMVIDKNGNLVETFANAPIIDGPWDMTVWDGGDLPVAFVSNALTGTVMRLDLVVGGPFGIKVHNATVIANGYGHQCDPVTFVDGPTGLAYDAETDALYVASSLDNAIYRVGGAAIRTSAANKGHLVTNDATHLNGPLHLALAPNGDLITANNDNIVTGSSVPPSEYVEFTKSGTFVTALQIETGGGAAFGFAFQKTGHHTATFAAVDDALNNLDIWTVNY